jgi:hypothetical protein
MMTTAAPHFQPIRGANQFAIVHITDDAEQKASGNRDISSYLSAVMFVESPDRG